MKHFSQNWSGEAYTACKTPLDSGVCCLVDCALWLEGEDGAVGGDDALRVMVPRVGAELVAACEEAAYPQIELPRAGEVGSARVETQAAGTCDVELVGDGNREAELEHKVTSIPFHDGFAGSIWVDGVVWLFGMPEIDF